MVIKNPDGKLIQFKMVNFEERNHLLKTEVVELYKVDRNFIFNNEIHLLKDGDYLFLYTADSYAFRFSSKEDVDLFTNNKDHFTCSIHVDVKKGSYHYMFNLHNIKAIEKMRNIVLEICEYPNRSPMLNFKLYRLNDGTYLRAEERAKDVYSARWFPDLETFEWYYENRMSD